jgi:ribosome-associated protein
MLKISNIVTIPEWEIQLSAIRSQGNGGQNVNKVATAIHLRFDIKKSSLPMFYKERLLAINDARKTNEGVIIIKAQSFRTQEQNKQDALERLKVIIQMATVTKKARIATRPTRNSQKRRVEGKKKNALKKSLRQKVK